jgi:hypothetical protein
MRSLGVLFAALFLAAAGSGARAGEDHHEHKAPHGGALLVLGEEFAHIELVLDAKTGKLTAYLLDGHAEKGLRSGQKEIALGFSVADGKVQYLKLKGVASRLTGETEADTSVFSGQSDVLKDVKTFKGSVESVTLKGRVFKDIKFGYPEGNEETH